MIDLLQKLYNKEISLDEAYDLQDAVIENPRAFGHNSEEKEVYLDRLLGYSEREWQADLFGVPLEAIARWRYEGWPETCFRCGRPIF